MNFAQFASVLQGGLFCSRVYVKKLSSFFIVTFFSPVHFCEQHNIALPVFWKYREKKPPSVSFSKAWASFWNKTPYSLALPQKSQQDTPENALTSSFDAATTTEGIFFLCHPFRKAAFLGWGVGGQGKEEVTDFLWLFPLLTKACRGCDAWRIFFEVVFCVGNFERLGVRICVWEKMSQCVWSPPPQIQRHRKKTNLFSTIDMENCLQKAHNF